MFNQNDLDGTVVVLLHGDLPAHLAEEAQEAVRIHPVHVSAVEP